MKMNQNKILNVVVPICGYGRRFQAAGIWSPKPLVRALGRTLVDWSISSLRLRGNYTFIIREEDELKFALGSYLRDTFGRCNLIQLKVPTEGAVCTVLAAERFINNDAPLVIANCDQYMEWNPHSFFRKINNFKADGALLTFRADHPKWSYVRINDENLVMEVAEKRVISNNANVGVYWFRKGKFFCDAARQMMRDETKRVNNEWYVAPVYNNMIDDGARIINFDVNRMLGLGVPDDIEYFKKNL